MSRVGFIGLGIMGEGMALNLAQAAGRDLAVWNRTVSKSQTFVRRINKIGRECVILNSPAEVITHCDMTFSMLSTPEVANDVFFRPDGVLSGISHGKSLIDCATLQPTDMTTFAEAVKKKNGRFLEAPVSGTKGPAADGSLIFMTAGDQSLYNEIDKELNAMGKASYYLGEVGSATRMKLTVNMVMGSMLASLAEGISLVQQSKTGDSSIVEDFMSIISLGAMNNPMFQIKGPNMIKNDFATNFPLKHAQKDMRLAIALADQFNHALPVAAASNELYKQAKKHGHGDSDFSAVITPLIYKPSS